jgi:hypothetical protein
MRQRIPLLALNLAWIVASIGIALFGGCFSDPHARHEVRQSDCVSCHLADYDNATDPVHVGTFPLECATCHSTVSFRPSTFVHEWPLTNAHAGAACNACHVGSPPVYAGTPRECVGCHLEDYNAVESPIHKDGLSMDCASCHTTVSFSPSTFVHAWPLVGVHLTAECTSCHGDVPPVYAGTATQCVGCHQADYDSSTYPGHNMFPTTCQNCHTPSGWTPAIGGTHPDDVFPISTGGHVTVACMDCHNVALGPSTGGMNTTCTACHTHQRAVVDAQHEGAAGYVYDAANQHFCLTCHPSGEN